jgi:hypothetical protein
MGGYNQEDILKKYVEVDWIHLSHERFKWRDSVNMEINFYFIQKLKPSHDSPCRPVEQNRN